MDGYMMETTVQLPRLAICMLDSGVLHHLYALAAERDS